MTLFEAGYFCARQGLSREAASTCPQYFFSGWLKWHLDNEARITEEEWEGDR